jgi:hypothetical protein
MTTASVRQPRAAPMVELPGIILVTDNVCSRGTASGAPELCFDTGDPIQPVACGARARRARGHSRGTHGAERHAGTMIQAGDIDGEGGKSIYPGGRFMV